MNNLISIINDLSSKTKGLHFYEEEGNTFLSYATCKQYIQSCARHFIDQGVQANDKIALNLQPTVEHIVCFLALIYIEAIPVSIKPEFGKKDEYENYLKKLARDYNIKYFYYDVNPSELLFTSLKSQYLKQSFYEVSAKPEHDENIAFVQFTSGSTSNPKPIEIKHNNIYHNMNIITQIDSRTEETVGFNFLPLNHDMGLIGGFLSNLYFKNSLHLTSVELFLRKIPFYLNLIKTHNISVTAMPNFILDYLVKRLKKSKKVDKYLLSSLKTVFVGAEPIREKTIKNFLNHACDFGFHPSALLFSYGLAETTLITTAHRFQNFETSFDINKFGEHVACVGEAVEDMKVFVDSKTAEGNIFINGKSVVQSLAKKDIEGEKYLDTGDIGYIKNNQLYVYGRERDMIIINGQNIFLVDIENYLNKSLSSDLSFDLQTIAVAYSGSFVVFLNSKKIISDDTLDHALRLLIEKFNIKPHCILHLPNELLLKTTSGKIRKNEIINNIKLNYQERWSY